MSKFSHQFSFLFSKKKLFQFQKKIQYFKNQPRFCRHFQRLLRRTSFIQFLMIRQMLLKEMQNKKAKTHSLQKIQLSKKYLQSKEYCSFLNIQITYKLWTLSLLPLLETEKRLRMFLTSKTNFQIYSILHQIFNTSSIQYVMIFQISNFWSSKNKLWTLSNVFIEKKFLINWLKSEKTQSASLNSSRNSIRLRTLIQYFSIVNICYFMKEKLSILSGLALTELQQKQLFAKKYYLKFNAMKLNLETKNRNSIILSSKFQNRKAPMLEFFEYNSFLFIPLTYETKSQSNFQTILSDLAESHGLTLKFVKLYPVSDGIDFLGWHFKKYLLDWRGRNVYTLLSLSNVRSHQKELKKYLKMAARKGWPC